MNIMNASILVVLFSLTSTITQAAPLTNYVSVGGGALTFDDSVDVVNPTQVYARIGHNFTPHFGVGVEANTSLVEDSLYGLDYSVTASFLYLKGSLPIGSNSKLYAVAGPTYVELTGSLGGISVSTDDNDVGFGVGYEYSFNKRHGVSADYTQYYDDGGVKVYSVNIGYVAYF